VRSLVERLSGSSTAGESGLTFELPGDMLAHALFPPITECVYLSIAKRVGRPEGWSELIGMDVLSGEVAKFLTELVHARATILINGAPESGRTTLLNVIGSEIAGDESTAIIDDQRELTLRRRPGLIKRPSEFDDSGRERRLVEAALRADAGRLVLNEVLGPEIVDVFSAIASHRVSVLACVPPTQARCEPRAIGEALLLLLHLEGLQPDTAVELVGSVAPVVIQTERLMDGQRWRVARIFSIAKNRGGALITRDLWQIDPATAQLTRTSIAFALRLHGATSSDKAARTDAESEADAQRRAVVLGSSGGRSVRNRPKRHPAGRRVDPLGHTDAYRRARA